MACGEYGPGRLPEPPAVWHKIAWALDIDPGDIALPGTPPPLFRRPQQVIEADDIEDAGIGLGGLSAAMINRSSIPVDLPIDDASITMHPEGLEEEAIPFNPQGPLMSRKGKARAAPPTDPQAINHTVSNSTGGAPEPLAGEKPDAFPGLAGASAQPPAGTLADPLEGQPDFDPDPKHRPLYGKHVLITAGPTHEAIDPVRYIANRSSGKQGFAIAAAAAAAGARVTLVSGPVYLPTPPGVDRIDVESAREMWAEVKRSLPADIGIMVAAVADWRVATTAAEKIKKRGSAPPALMLTENPDILATLSGDPKRPKLLIGFAAETEEVIKHAKEKRKRKGADWIIANDVSGGKGESVMGGEANTVHIITAKGVEDLPEMPKEKVAWALVERIIGAVK
jgi:phosphopantothenoylcysteine decarboxylase/phosphopantothenate--cysteine ligase